MVVTTPRIPQTNMLSANCSPGLRSAQTLCPARDLRQFLMRAIVLFLLVVESFAQSSPLIQNSHTGESLRGVSTVSRQIAWASGTHGTYLRTIDGGRTWTPAQVPGATALDFRAVVAFSPDEAFLMSAGPGDQSRIYHTADAGQHWQLQFTNTNPKGFFDSMAFWDSTHGIVLGDPVADEIGKLKFELLQTNDGQTWHAIPSSHLPDALEGEGAFAASNTCLAILKSHSVIASNVIPSTHSVILSADKRSAQPSACRSRRTLRPAVLRDSSTSDTSPHDPADYAPPPNPSWKSGASAPRQPDPNIWFATGGKAARVFHSPDRGRTWQVIDTPIVHGPDSAGIFSIAFRDTMHGIIAGGDYKHPNDNVPNLAFTDDGGKTWNLHRVPDAQGYLSAIALSPRSPRFFLVGPDYILDSDDSRHTKYSNQKFNAISQFPKGGALAVGPKGAIAVTP
jgi:photosystem II stability/assembly factor-like uncharacterized protein